MRPNKIFYVTPLKRSMTSMKQKSDRHDTPFNKIKEKKIDFIDVTDLKHHIADKTLSIDEYNKKMQNNISLVNIN